MGRLFKINLLLLVSTFVITCVVMIFVMREPTVPMTAEVLAGAREMWRTAEIKDYDLRYTMNGNVCEVTVRGGIVTALRVNGIEGRSSQWRFFSMDGLFETLAMDLEAVTDSAGAFAGNADHILMRVRFNPVFGHVERYIRSSGGLARGAEIELHTFTPIPAR